MANLINLIYNELFKIYIRKSTWAMYIILSILIIGGAILTNSFDNTNDKYADDDWREVLEEENATIEAEANVGDVGELYFNWEYEINDYHLENDIRPTYSTWDYTQENISLLSIVSLFTIIIGAGIVANEFRWGTIKQLLIRPISRSKILASKYIAVLLFALFTSLFLMLFSWIVGTLFFGTNGFDPYIVLEKSGEYLHVSAINEIVLQLGFGFVNLIMMTTFAFMISTVFRNSSLAIGTAIFLMMAGNTIVAVFMEKEWAKYILFANTDLSQYVNGNEPWIEGMTLGFSITMLLIYYVIFQLLSWVFFAKRDVAGQ